jgi:hypothetical protein
MIIAIEQSLLAAKLFWNSEKRKLKNTPLPATWDTNLDERSTQILHSLKVRVTSIRIEVLKVILSSTIAVTVGEIHKIISRRRPISKTAVISTIMLFKARGLIRESKKALPGKHKIRGRPQMKYMPNIKIKRRPDR